MWRLKEDVYYSNGEVELFDTSRRLLEHVLINYNLLRKSLGMPFDSYYTSKKIPLLEKWKKNKERRQFEKKLKKVKENKSTNNSLY